MALPRRIQYRKLVGGSWVGGLSTTGDPMDPNQAVNVAALQQSRMMRAQANIGPKATPYAAPPPKSFVNAPAAGDPNSGNTGAQMAKEEGKWGKTNISNKTAGGLSAAGDFVGDVIDTTNTPDTYGRTSTGKSIASGAVKGAAKGAQFGVYGAIIGGVVGGAVGGIKSATGNRKADRLQSRDNSYALEANKAMSAQRYMDDPSGGTTGREWFARKGGQLATEVPYKKTRPVYPQKSYLKMGDGGNFAPEDYYKSSATLQHYKEILNEKLKAKNPEAYTNYFKGMQGAGDRNAYVQNTPYNEYLSPDEVKSTLGNDYNAYTSSLSAVNKYNVSQGQQPLYGNVEGQQDVSNLNYGRRFASLQTTPSIGVGGVYSRNYGYNPATKAVDVTETGDVARRPVGFYPPNTTPMQTAPNMTAAKAYGGYIDEYRKGGGIHINPKNKGKFNALKKRTGKSTEELTHSKNPLTRKRAVFAQNAKKWKH